MGTPIHSSSVVDDLTASHHHQDTMTRGRWWLVAAALLLQFSIGAVYAWSVFSKALSVAEPFHLSKLEAATRTCPPRRSCRWASDTSSCR